MPHTPGEQTRNAVTQPIAAHVAAGWPRLGAPQVTWRSRYCHAAVKLPATASRPRSCACATRQPQTNGPSAYKATTGQYSENEFPWPYGPLTGTREQGIDETLELCAGPPAGR